MAKRTGAYHDWGKTYKQFSYAIADAGHKMTNELKRDMTYLMQELISEMDAEWPQHTVWKRKSGKSSVFGGDRNHPWYTGQLHDSVAIRIAEGNKTVSISYMPQHANGGPQHTSASDGAKFEHIIGADWAHEVAERKTPYYFLPGIQAQLIIAVPYANKVNQSERHAGFIEELSVDVINKVDDYMTSGALARKRIVANPNTKIQNVRRMR